MSSTPPRRTRALTILAVHGPNALVVVLVLVVFFLVVVFTVVALPALDVTSTSALHILVPILAVLLLSPLQHLQRSSQLLLLLLGLLSPLHPLLRDLVDGHRVGLLGEYVTNRGLCLCGWPSWKILSYAGPLVVLEI
jgi:hypothetical protein